MDKVELIAKMYHEVLLEDDIKLTDIQAVKFRYACALCIRRFPMQKFEEQRSIAKEILDIILANPEIDINSLAVFYPDLKQ